MACALLLAGLLVQPASARFQTNGFVLDELIAAGGAGPDPGAENTQARLKWAVETAIPREWRESVPVVWTVGNAGRGHLALSYLDGRTILSPRLMSRSAEELLATVAHEMGHQIAFALVSPVFGMPPQGFMDIAPSYNDVREGWADCVARVWTGSNIALSEPAACSTEMAGYVSGLLADPATLGATVRTVPPPIHVPAPAPPAPAPVPVARAPVVHIPPAPVLVAPSPAKPRVGQAQGRRPASGSSGLPIALGLVPLPLAIGVLGYLLVRKRSERLLAWATGADGPKAGNRA